MVADDEYLFFSGDQPSSPGWKYCSSVMALELGKSNKRRVNKIKVYVVEDEAVASPAPELAGQRCRRQTMCGP